MTDIFPKFHVSMLIIDRVLGSERHMYIFINMSTHTDIFRAFAQEEALETLCVQEKTLHNQ